MELELEQTRLNGYEAVVDTGLFPEETMEMIVPDACPDILRILNTEGMIRSKRKIEAIINNAKCFLKVIDEWGSFDRYIWSFSEGYTFIYRKHQRGEGEARNELSDRLSRDMKKRGFKYLGSITIYSHLQACGIINDHEPGCFKYEELLKENRVKYIED